jgi:SAM-dependent methyltransferase
MGATRYPLVQGAAEQLPFASGCFDVVFCDHGGLSWAPPDLAVPEAARVLRRPGRLAFSVTSPWFAACYNDDAGQVTTRLQRDYFSLGAIAEEHGAATYQLTYGGWIRTLRGPIPECAAATWKPTRPTGLAAGRRKCFGLHANHSPHLAAADAGQRTPTGCIRGGALHRDLNAYPVRSLSRRRSACSATV